MGDLIEGPDIPAGKFSLTNEFHRVTMGESWNPSRLKHVLAAAETAAEAKKPAADPENISLLDAYVGPSLGAAELESGLGGCNGGTFDNHPEPEDLSGGCCNGGGVDNMDIDEHEHAEPYRLVYGDDAKVSGTLKSIMGMPRIKNTWARRNDGGMS